MAHQAGLTFSPSAQAVEIVRERLHRSGFTITEAAARSLLEAVLAVEAPRMQAISRGILHGSLETIRQTAEVALGVLREARLERPDLVGVVKEHLSTEPGPGPRRRDERPQPDRHSVDEEREDYTLDEDARPVFRRPRGR
jgi:hypothetical protein